MSYKQCLLSVEQKQSILEQYEQEKQTIDIEYSLDKYFIPENTGRDLEKAALKGNVIATIKVRDGKAILTNVEVK